AVPDSSAATQVATASSGSFAARRMVEVRVDVCGMILLLGGESSGCVRPRKRRQSCLPAAMADCSAAVPCCVSAASAADCGNYLGPRGTCSNHAVHAAHAAHAALRPPGLR